MQTRLRIKHALPECDVLCIQHRTRGFCNKVWRIGEEGQDLLFVFRAHETAACVHQPASCANQRSCRAENARLQGDDLPEIALGEAPLQVGITPQGAASAAWRIDKHSVGLADQLGKLRIALIGDHDRLNIAQPCTHQARFEPRKARSRHIAGKYLAGIAQGSADGKCLSSGPGTEVHHHLTAPGSEQRGNDLTASVLHLDQARGEGARLFQRWLARDTQGIGHSGAGIGSNAILRKKRNRPRHCAARSSRRRRNAVVMRSLIAACELAPSTGQRRVPDRHAHIECGRHKERSKECARSLMVVRVLRLQTRMQPIGQRITYRIGKCMLPSTEADSNRVTGPGGSAHGCVSLLGKNRLKQLCGSIPGLMRWPPGRGLGGLGVVQQPAVMTQHVVRPFCKGLPVAAAKLLCGAKVAVQHQVCRIGEGGKLPEDLQRMPVRKG